MSAPRGLTPVRAIKVRPGRHVELPEHLAVEEPMEIRAAGPGQEAVPVAVTMRTPGHDFELAAGFLVTEGLVHRDEVRAVGYCDAVDLDDGGRFNTVTVSLSRAWTGSPARPFTATASCGICGKTSIDQVEVACPPVVESEPLPASLIPALPELLRASQRVFERTGGLHAAGLFDRSGSPLCVREDVGRHNAVDKVAGHTILDHADGRAGPVGAVPSAVSPLSACVLMVSGRVSFEIVQKAAMCGIGTIAAVSAPSSLAVAAADRLGVTVAGFVRGSSYNVYSHPERLAFEE
jgi:FdhD protein